MFTGLRISAGLAVVGAIVGEFFFRRGDTGLGHLIETYRPADTTTTTPRCSPPSSSACLLGIVVFIVFGYPPAPLTQHVVRAGARSTSEEHR